MNSPFKVFREDGVVNYEAQFELPNDGTPQGG